MSRIIREQSEAILTELRQMATALAVQKAETRIFALTTAKGFTFEDIVHIAVSEVAAPHGDVPEALGRSSGTDGSNVGDEVVTINPEDTGGLRAAIVLEAKNRKLSMRKLTDELDRAMANRDALVAIGVFAHQEQAPVAVPFAPFGDKAILVLDEVDTDKRLMQLAYMWARWTARRKLNMNIQSVDVELVEAAIADARVALERSVTIRRCHSTARKHIDQASSELVDLVQQVDEALKRLRRALGE